jgi:hypothetical protein
MTTYYKVLNKDNQAQDGGNFDYTDYVPGGSKEGEWTPIIDNTKECERGYHVTRYWNMWIKTAEDNVYEVEVDGLVETNESGVVTKAVGCSIRFVKKCSFVFDTKSNTGDRNTGNSNTGDNNTGDNNTGDNNTGYRNTGNSNTGNSNTGDRNTGNSNTGNSNTGNRNTGDNNTGDNNTGYRNTGNRNTGYRNTGNWNTGDRNTGAFNTTTPKSTMLFNKKILWERYEKIIFPKYFYFVIEKEYKKSWGKAFDNATKEEIEQTIKLPNFSYRVFAKVTGITKKMITKRLKA